MKLSLDATALNALFPEGTEARVELQQAVLGNFVKNMFSKSMPKEVKEYVEGIITEHRNMLDSAITEGKNAVMLKAAADYGAVKIETGYLGQPPRATFTPEFNQKLRDEVRTAISGEFSPIVTAAVKSRVDELLADGSKYDQYINRQIQGPLNTGILAKVTEALKE